MRAIFTRSSDPGQGVVPVELGGTGTRNPNNLRNSLNLVTESDKDVVGGVIPLDAQGKIPLNRLPNLGNANVVSLNGSFNVYVGTTVQFQITDYDSFKTYDVAFSSGLFTINEDVISYTSPATAQPVTLTINGRQIDFTVALPQPGKPSIVSPINGAVNQTQAPSFIATPYAYMGGNVAHKDSSWQIATDSNFTNIVSQSVNDAVNKTSWIPSVPISANTAYFARVSYRDVNNVQGLWSETISFNTKTQFVPMVEEAKIVAPDRQAQDYFGGFGDSRSIALDHLGNRVAIGASGTDYSGFTNQGSVYVFQRIAGSWALETRIDITDSVTTEGFGLTVDMDDGGNRIVIGNRWYSGPASTSGRAFVYVRNGTTWTRERIFEPTSPTSGHHSGWTVAINKDGNRIAIGNNRRFVEIWRRSGTTWTKDQDVSASDGDGTTDASFGQREGCICFDKNADRLFIGAPTGGNASPALTGTGAVYIYLRSGTSWTQEQKIVNATVGQASQFGNMIDTDFTGTRIVIGARNEDKAFVYLRTGTVWTQESVLAKNGVDVSQSFGFQVAMNYDGSVIAVAAHNANNVTPALSDSGYVAIYQRVNTNWNFVSKLTVSDQYAGSAFGLNMDMSSDGNRLVGSTPLQTITGVSQAGAAYAFS